MERLNHRGVNIISREVKVTGKDNDESIITLYMHELDRLLNQMKRNDDVEEIKLLRTENEKLRGKLERATKIISSDKNRFRKINDELNEVVSKMNLVHTGTSDNTFGDTVRTSEYLKLLGKYSKLATACKEFFNNEITKSLFNNIAFPRQCGKTITAKQLLEIMDNIPKEKYVKGGFSDKGPVPSRFFPRGIIFPMATIPSGFAKKEKYAGKQDNQEKQEKQNYSAKLFFRPILKEDNSVQAYCFKGHSNVYCHNELPKAYFDRDPFFFSVSSSIVCFCYTKQKTDSTKSVHTISVGEEMSKWVFDFLIKQMIEAGQKLTNINRIKRGKSSLLYKEIDLSKYIRKYADGTVVVTI